MSRLITVFGASGNQGGSVADALAADSHFKVRAITRNPTCSKIQQLRQYGNVEVMQADLNDAESVEAALDGAYGCFIVTYADLCDENSVEKEKEQGMTIANACRAHPTLKHIIFSTQLSPKQTLGQEARQCDAKAYIDKRMREMNLPMTAIEVPFYYENFLNEFRPERISENCHRISIPMGQVPMDCISLKDLGEIVRRIFTQAEKYMYKTIGVSGDKLTVGKLAEEMTRWLYGQRVIDRQMTYAEYRDSPIKGARDKANLFDFRARVDQRFNVMATQQIHPYVMSFRDWCRENQTNLQRICS